MIISCFLLFWNLEYPCSILILSCWPYFLFHKNNRKKHRISTNPHLIYLPPAISAHILCFFSVDILFRPLFRASPSHLPTRGHHHLFIHGRAPASFPSLGDHQFPSLYKVIPISMFLPLFLRDNISTLIPPPNLLHSFIWQNILKK